MIIDGVRYRWKSVEDSRNYSLDFSHRGVSYPNVVQIDGDDVTAISFDEPRFSASQWGWWRPSRRLDDQAIERAVRMAKQGGLKTLSAKQVDEVLYGPPRTLQDELDVATATLVTDADTFVDCILAIGCCAYGPRPEIADWIASHANELAGGRLQRLLVTHGGDWYIYCYRSSVEFLAEMCGRVNVELGLDLGPYDAELRTHKYQEVRPWGIPEAHWWWRQGRPGASDPRPDPYD